MNQSDLTCKRHSDHQLQNKHTFTDTNHLQKLNKFQEIAKARNHTKYIL